jgi:membrane protein
VLLLVWVYYSAQILFFGAELTQVYARRHGSRLGMAAETGPGASPATAPVDTSPSLPPPPPPPPPSAAVGRGLAISAVLLLIGLFGRKSGR